MATLYLVPISINPQWFSNLGIMAQGGSLTTLVGGSVSTPATTYTDSTGIVANPNPMTLSSTGRAVSASGAPVAFWVPSGTVIDLYVNDSAGNQLQVLKNLSALNDPAASGTLQAQLASPASANAAGVGPVAGVDLVANAVKSYDIFADLRAANAPSLASGQTLVAEIEGGATVNDGNGGPFFWSAASTAADNGSSVIKPNSLAGAAAGRWLRLVLPASIIGNAPSFSGNVTVGSTTNACVQGARKNLQMITTGTSQPVTISADAIAVGTGFDTFISVVTGIALTLNLTNPVGANGLDTGTTTVSTWYYVYIISGTSGTASIASLSQSAPALPTGYTQYALIGAIRTDASGNKYPLKMQQYNTTVQYVVAAGSNVANLPAIAQGASGNPSTPTWTGFVVTNFVPLIASRIKLVLAHQNANVGVGSIAAPNNSYGPVTSATNPPPLCMDSGANAYSSLMGEFMLEGTAPWSVYYAASNSSDGLYCMGFELNL